MHTVNNFPSMADVIDSVLDTHDIRHFFSDDIKTNILTGQIWEVIQEHWSFECVSNTLVMHEAGVIAEFRVVRIHNQNAIGAVLLRMTTKFNGFCSA